MRYDKKNNRNKKQNVKISKFSTFRFFENKMFIEKTSPLLYRVLGVFLPLITTNCAVLGVALQNANKDLNFMQSSLYGFGAGIGFSLVLIFFSAMRERLAAADIPPPFEGAAPLRVCLLLRPAPSGA